jgi:hypothetical protein
MSFTGLPLATKTVALVLVDPPRPLTLNEYSYALSMVNEYLPSDLADDSEFLPKPVLDRLVEVVKQLQVVEGGRGIEDKFARQQIRYFGPKLLKTLKLVENGEWPVGPGPNE